LGAAVGAALAGLLVVLLGNLPWWGWLLLIVIGLVVGFAWARRRSPAADDPTPADAEADPAPPPPAS
jgi:hypothetical protein